MICCICPKGGREPIFPNAAHCIDSREARFADIGECKRPKADIGRLLKALRSRPPSGYSLHKQMEQAFSNENEADPGVIGKNWVPSQAAFGVNFATRFLPCPLAS